MGLEYRQFEYIYFVVVLVSMLVLLASEHYDNTPMEYSATFNGCELTFLDEKLYFFLFFLKT